MPERRSVNGATLVVPRVARRKRTDRCRIDRPVFDTQAFERHRISDMADTPTSPDRYARYGRLKFDRPHPRVLRITLSSPLKMGAMDAQMHREVSQIWADVDADDS